MLYRKCLQEEHKALESKKAKHKEGYLELNVLERALKQKADILLHAARSLREVASHRSMSQIDLNR